MVTSGIHGTAERSRNSSVFIFSRTRRLSPTGNIAIAGISSSNADAAAPDVTANSAGVGTRIVFHVPEPRCQEIAVLRFPGCGVILGPRDIPVAIGVLAEKEVIQ